MWTNRSGWKIGSGGGKGRGVGGGVEAQRRCPLTSRARFAYRLGLRMANARTRAGSNLLLDEYWEAGDDRYVDEVLSLTAGKKLKSLADRWLKDSRPFARRTLLAYIGDGCD